MRQHVVGDNLVFARPPKAAWGAAAMCCSGVRAGTDCGGGAVRITGCGKASSALGGPGAFFLRRWPARALPTPPAIACEKLVVARSPDRATPRHLRSAWHGTVGRPWHNRARAT